MPGNTDVPSSDTTRPPPRSSSRGNRRATTTMKAAALKDVIMAWVADDLTPGEEVHRARRYNGRYRRALRKDWDRQHGRLSQQRAETAVVAVLGALLDEHESRRGVRSLLGASVTQRHGGGHRARLDPFARRRPPWCRSTDRRPPPEAAYRVSVDLAISS